MAKYRKKPVVIDAALVRDDDNFESVARWCGGRALAGDEGAPDGIEILTLEGTMRADMGDWIMRGVAGEFYPCKPDIFLATYEPA